MKECIKVKNLIQKSLKEKLSEQKDSLLQKHIEVCKECQEDLNLYLKIKEKLKEFEYKELPYTFANKLHTRLVEEANKIHTENIIKEIIFGNLYKYALAFGVFLLVIFATFTYTIRKSSKNILLFVPGQQFSLASNYIVQNSVPLNKEGIVRVKISSKKELKNVKVQIYLPKELSVDGKTNIINWKGDLKAGDNFIAIKVKGVKEGEYPVEVKIKKDSKEKSVVKIVKITRL